MFVRVVRGNEFVEEPKELVDLLSGVVGVVCCVFYFKGVVVVAFACHDVWEWVEAGVAYGHPNCVVAFFLKQFDQYGFAVEASFAPTPKSYSVNFFAQTVSPDVLLLVSAF